MRVRHNPCVTFSPLLPRWREMGAPSPPYRRTFSRPWLQKFNRLFTKNGVLAGPISLIVGATGHTCRQHNPARQQDPPQDPHTFSSSVSSCGGVNDAPVLARADIGITMGGETDRAMAVGDITRVGGSCAPLPQCGQRRLARRSSCGQVLLAHGPSSLIRPALVPTGER
jgi:hypothetical protein